MSDGSAKGEGGAGRGSEREGETRAGIPKPPGGVRDGGLRAAGEIRQREEGVGAAVVREQYELLTPEDLLSAADSSLYEAKRKGRNHVRTAVPRLVQSKTANARSG